MTTESEAGAPRRRATDPVRRSRSKVFKIALTGVVLLSLAVGVRVWWARTAPEREARLAELIRTRTLQQQLAQTQAQVRDHPKDPAAYLALASAQFSSGDTDSGLATLRRGTEVAPGDNLSWQNLANAYLEQRRFAAAEETFREMARRWPNSADPLQGLAVILRHTGRYSEALPAAQKAVQLAPNRPTNHYVLGAIIEEIGYRAAFPAGQTGLLEEGRKHLALAAKELPQHPDADFKRGRICLLIRRVDEAREALGKAVQLTPRRATAWLALAEARMRSGDVDGAITAARQGRDLSVMEAEGPLALGRALLLKSDKASLEEGAAAFEQATRLNPQRAECYERLGTALLRLDRIKEARVAFEKDLELNPHNPYPAQQLAQIYQRLGDLKLAQAAAKQASTLGYNERLLRQVQRTSAAHPENPKIHLALADRYREIGWLAQAEDEYHAALAIMPADARAKRGLAEVRRDLALKQTP